MNKKKTELILRSIPNLVIFSILGLAYSIVQIPKKIKEYLGFMKQMHKDVWYSELRWDLCDKYDGCEWEDSKNISSSPNVEIIEQRCKFCKNNRLRC